MIPGCTYGGVGNGVVATALNTRGSNIAFVYASLRFVQVCPLLNRCACIETIKFLVSGRVLHPCHPVASSWVESCELVLNRVACNMLHRCVGRAADTC